ncbi:MAG: gluconokinase [Sciscionella sp.]
MSETQRVLLGVDLGTSATKVVVVDETMRMLGESERTYPLRTEHGNEAVQDPAVVLEATMSAVAERAAACAKDGIEVAGLCFSAAMHTLLALDGDHRPITDALSWADTRAAAIARGIRADHRNDLAVATGTPVHPMSPLCKLAWFAERQPGTHRDARWWSGLKDYVVWCLTSRLVMDLSCASGTGLLELRTRDWYQPALRIAGIGADRLPELVDPTEPLELNEESAEALGLPAGLPVMPGAGDGPLANLGVGAVEPGTAALSIGTSGALRVARDSPAVDEHGTVFCYYLAEDIWVIGGAVSNGGMVGDWVARTFSAEVGPLLEEAAAAGSDGLLALPYLVGERAPWWDPDPRGALLGLRARHGRAEITHAMIEGVAQQLALVGESVRAAGAHPRAVRATGGAFRSELWADLLAAALDVPLDIADESAGSGFGAALLGWRALDVLPSLHSAADLVRPHRTVRPDSRLSEQMRAARPLVERAYRLVRDLHEAGLDTGP